MKAIYAVVGMQHRGTADFLKQLPEGEPMTLVREPENDFDCNAVQVWARGKHIGFVPKTQSRALAVAMDARGKPPRLPDPSDGVTVVGKLTYGGQHRWPMIEVDE